MPVSLMNCDVSTNTGLVKLNDIPEGIAASDIDSFSLFKAAVYAMMKSLTLASNYADVIASIFVAVVLEEDTVSLLQDQVGGN